MLSQVHRRALLIVGARVPLSGSVPICGYASGRQRRGQGKHTFRSHDHHPIAPRIMPQRRISTTKYTPTVHAPTPTTPSTTPSTQTTKSAHNGDGKRKRPGVTGQSKGAKAGKPRQEKIASAANFDVLGLPSHVTRALEFKKPSRIQASAIPHLLRPWDKTTRGYKPVPPVVVVQDVTGTGKTLAYLLPIIAAIDKSLSCVQAVIVVPTRELAVQVGKATKKLADGSASKKKKHLTDNKSIVVRTLVGKVNPFMLSRLGVASKSDLWSKQLAAAGYEEQEGETEAGLTGDVLQPHVLVASVALLDALLLHGSDIWDLSRVSHWVFDECDYLMANHKLAQSARRLLRHSLFLPNRTRAPPANAGNDTAVVAVAGARPPSQTVFVSATITQDVVKMAQGLGDVLYLSAGREQLWRKGHAPVATSESKRAQSAEQDEGGQDKGNSVETWSQHSALPKHVKHFMLTYPAAFSPMGTAKRRMDTLYSLLLSLTKPVLQTAPSSASGLRPEVAGRHTKASGTVLVFFNRMDSIKEANLQKRLWNKGISCVIITETASRNARQAAGGGKHAVDVIFTTDAMSRGMDFKDLSHVINVELPSTKGVYLHRCGRVGRLSGDGLRFNSNSTVLTLATSDSISKIRLLADSLGFQPKRVLLDAEKHTLRIVAH